MNIFRNGRSKKTIQTATIYLHFTLNLHTVIICDVRIRDRVYAGLCSAKEDFKRTKPGLSPLSWLMASRTADFPPRRAPRKGWISKDVLNIHNFVF